MMPYSHNERSSSIENNKGAQFPGNINLKNERKINIKGGTQIIQNIRTNTPLAMKRIYAPINLQEKVKNDTMNVKGSYNPKLNNSERKNSSQNRADLSNTSNGQRIFNYGLKEKTIRIDPRGKVIIGSVQKHEIYEGMVNRNDSSGKNKVVKNKKLNKTLLIPQNPNFFDKGVTYDQREYSNIYGGNRRPNSKSNPFSFNKNKF